LKKISRNVERDKEAVDTLQHGGWRILIVWECALRGTRRISLEKVLKKTESFLAGNRKILQVTGC
jgi:DNA mismatch endonuclease (patch repair protein)